ncbi:MULTISPECIES: PAS domain-containing sensor histidine kinase [Apibacter]|uniref:sensor histidine kinase n=1 Tax=Apibacter TaxID=1778601 RepID=UPI0013299C97|nr:MULTISPECIES: HAMP domain-containing sensor histidine kinase [Apibacter]MCX8677661.1 ATP-binding protein [Apibacter sp. B3919]MXO24143.1 sensor histidine kinase [Apibacter sp. B3924]MXO26925.1 sensor histidine kinase [Apibacter sp. B3813]MXO28947.1 sensor histidine kinase [Apibacter sp. B3913]MXO30898.1 sensor histidine kinase [Apibacter sp. B3912]
MSFFKNVRLRNWFGYILALIVALFIIIFSNSKVEELKEEESVKISNYAKTLELLNTETDIPPKTQFFLVQLIEQNTTIPVILVDEKGNYIDSKNVSKKIISDSLKLKEELHEMAESYYPILIKLPFGNQYVYYKNSVLLTQLGYYPFVLIILVTLFVWFTYWYFKTVKKTEQSLLWAGMAKETAHQIGTPLSSIMGWLEILKTEEIDQKPIINIEKDVHRLQNITDRFSKIGSTPSLKKEDIVEISEQAFMYLKRRMSKQIGFEFQAPEYPVYVSLNNILYSWVIENLIKNSADAMKGEGKIKLQIHDNKKNIFIDISDEGSGIESKNVKKIFKPGFTTKKRGWGLGLSLARRIIEDYHYGKIFVQNTEINKGTTFRIILKK